MTEDPAPVELVPERIRELIPACHEYVRRAVGVEIDGTPETLPVIDHYIRLARESLVGRPELLPLVARALAAYFGELVRGTFGGFWHVPADDAHEWLVCFSGVFLAISPLGIAYDAINGGGDHDGPSAHLRVSREDRDRVHERLAALPPVREDEFFTLGTRFEAIEVAVESLLAASSDGGEGGVFFEVEDYLDDLAAARL